MISSDTSDKALVRLFLRVPVNIPANVLAPGKGPSIAPVTLVDLSTTGAAFVTDVSPQMFPDFFDLSFSLGPKKAPIFISAAKRAVTTLGEKHRIGSVFNTNDKKLIDSIHRFISKMIETGPAVIALDLASGLLFAFSALSLAVSAMLAYYAGTSFGDGSGISLSNVPEIVFAAVCAVSSFVAFTMLRGSTLSGLSSRTLLIFPALSYAFSSFYFTAARVKWAILPDYLRVLFLSHLSVCLVSAFSLVVFAVQLANIKRFTRIMDEHLSKTRPDDMETDISVQ
ncbi:MAG: PilZ domain-containing protein [Candidatus Omnitrophica bacterium]|nr:PilZ domain-containing protein [Candidatus Omnitrophota bacterium]